MPPTRRNDSAIVETLKFMLAALGALSFIGGFIGAIAGMMGNTGPAPLESTLWKAAQPIALGVSAAAIFWTLAAILFLLEDRPRSRPDSPANLDPLTAQLARIEESLREAKEVAANREAAFAPAAPIEHAPAHAITSSDLLPILQQMRDLMLMTEAQRSELLQRQQAARAAEMTAEIASVSERVRHLMSISAWTQATTAASELTQKYPDSTGASALAQQVQKERSALESEASERLFLDLADATDHRQWRRAVGIANEILMRYPAERRTEKLRHDLATLRENAGAQERKESEELFKDLLKRQRYEEALEVARTLIEKYPLSPAAAELTRLLPRVEEYIRAENAKRTTA